MGGRQLSAADRDNITNGLLSFHMVGFMSGEIETIYPVICSMGQKPHNYAAFLALLLWWTHILEADFCCIILKIFFRAKVYFFVISYFGAKDS